MKFFGFTLGQEKKKSEEENLQSFVQPDLEDGSIEVASGGSYGSYVDFEGKVKSEGLLVTKYREMASKPECDEAIKDIVDEGIINEDNSPIVDINLEDVDVGEPLKKKIQEEFAEILSMLDFDNNAHEIFKKWYVDGRLYYHAVVDVKNPKLGIQQLRYIDPRTIRKVKEPIRKRDGDTGAILQVGSKEYYLFNPAGLKLSQSQAIKIAADSIIFAHSGLMDVKNSMVHSHLHKAIKPLNQLNMLEDAVVIYRLSRAPERRVFYIDVGNLPKMKAEQYLRDMMAKHKNRIVYDAQTGQVRDDRKFMTMLEDFWIPRREGSRGTEITTLPPGQNLGEMEDVEYFKRKLYKALNVPVSRMDADSTFNLGRATEITRDELKFQKFIDRLRMRFTILFDNSLEIHLALKGIVSRQEWKAIRQKIKYQFARDSHFTELKDAEVFRERLQLLEQVDAFEQKYFSREWVMRNILKMSDDDIKDMQKQMEAESKDFGDDMEGTPDGMPPPEQPNTEQPKTKPEEQKAKESDKEPS